MDNITYKYIKYDGKEFEQVINLRFDVLFKPYGKITKYDYDELDNISFHLVAVCENTVVGYSRMTNFNGEGKITNVVVSQDYTKRGIGFEMLKKHIIKAKDEMIMNLHLNSRLETVNFYEKVGFISIGDTFLSDKSGLILQEMCFKVS